MMWEYFVTVTKMKDILFKGWSTNSTNDVLLASFITFLLTVFLEALKVAKTCLISRRKAHPINDNVNDYSTFENETTAPQAELLSSLGDLSSLHYIRTEKAKLFVVESLLHMFNFAYAYLLMLLVMTYSVWFLIAVVFGSGVGFFVWSPLGQRFTAAESSKKNVSEECHTNPAASLNNLATSSVMTMPLHSDTDELLNRSERSYDTFLPTQE